VKGEAARRGAVEEDFNLAGQVSVGQYLPGDSLLHRMDPRAKIMAFIALIAGASYVDTYLGNLVVLAVLLSLFRLFGIPLGYALRGLRPAAGLILLFVVFQLFFGGNFDPTGGRVLWQLVAPFSLGPIQPRVAITEWSLRTAIIVVPRVAEFWLLACLLTFTTDTTRLTHGLESLLSPFRVVRVPAHELAMVLTITLRFVPTLAEETDRIMKAQASRGADFGRPGPFRFIRTAKNLAPVLVPMFVLTFRRMEELILAMESRCYVGGRGRTRLAQLTMRPADWLALAAAFGAAAFFFLVRLPV
jgi:energy-coupling factor transport system permease protein